MTSTRRVTSLRRRKPPQHQQLIAMRQLDLAPAVVTSSKMAAATDIDIGRTDRRPSLVDLRNVLSLDDFDAFCVRASSGGSIYGMLRKQLSSSCGAQDTSIPGRRVPPGKRVMERQRSKSLIQRSVALSEEKSIIKLLCDYTETKRSKQRLMHDNRRHSEVTMATQINNVRMSMSHVPATFYKLLLRTSNAHDMPTRHRRRRQTTAFCRHSNTGRRSHTCHTKTSFGDRTFVVYCFILTVVYKSH